MQFAHGSALAGGPEAADPLGRQLTARGPYLFPDIKAELFISELKQHTQSPGTGWAISSGLLGGGGEAPPAIARHFAKELLQLVRPDEIFYPKLIIIMNLYFFPQENN